LTVFELEGFKPFQESFDQFDLLKDQEVTVGSLKHAIALGVNECGALQVRTPQGVQSIVSQEVSVRPKPFNTSAD
jgi:BirA family biotin operon repressor/biotin-[acetyl-CoA-carboxylase] ligase